MSLYLVFASLLALCFLFSGSSFAVSPVQHVLTAPSEDERPDISAEATWPTEMHAAIEAMQQEFFDVWQGTWPSAIDWTAAVLGTHLPSTALALSEMELPSEHVCEDMINTYFSQLIAFYYGQDWLALRGQANDDMLWVVLGWLEATTFIETHSHDRHEGDVLPWYGQKFLSAFGHRARIFWEIASKGWDETLCGGGMVWNPRLAPYKNAITNQLFISASISMYLYFPGDDIDKPFSAGYKFPAHEEKYLQAAVKAYDWLQDSNMTNSQGLYVDGYHIEGWRGGQSPSNGTGRCDVRNEMVYTYNQGVILTGLRGLYIATSDPKYLEHGHELIRSVVRATGWDISSDEPTDTKTWQGLGRLGVLEERCDILGTCSQDAQTFKGIFFLHYAAFCKPIPSRGSSPGEIIADHRERCASYAAWVEHNAWAALMTKDSKDLFGMWWTEKLWSESTRTFLQKAEKFGPNGQAGTDYRNEGIPHDEVWKLADTNSHDHTSLMRQEKWRQLSLADKHDSLRNTLHSLRSAEIQSGGLSLMKAFALHLSYEDLS